MLEFGLYTGVYFSKLKKKKSMASSLSDLALYRVNRNATQNIFTGVIFLDPRNQAQAI